MTTNDTETKIPETVDTQEKLPDWTECMSYGSERFESATANNHNIIIRVDSQKAQKVVLGNDVVLTMPKDPSNIETWSSYPTHQESWLPLWYVATYHTQAKS